MPAQAESSRKSPIEARCRQTRVDFAAAIDALPNSDPHKPYGRDHAVLAVESTSTVNQYLHEAGFFPEDTNLTAVRVNHSTSTGDKIDMFLAFTCPELGEIPEELLIYREPNEGFIMMSLENNSSKPWNLRPNLGREDYVSTFSGGPVGPSTKEYLHVNHKPLDDKIREKYREIGKPFIGKYWLGGNDEVLLPIFELVLKQIQEGKAERAYHRSEPSSAQGLEFTEEEVKVFDKDHTEGME